MPDSPNGFTRAQHTQLAAAMLAAIKPLEERFGVRISGNGGSYGLTAVVKFEVARVGDSGEAETPERQAFRTLASSYGLKPDDLGRKFTYSGSTYKLAGLRPRATRRPLIAEEEGTGKLFTFPADLVVALLPKQ